MSAKIADARQIKYATVDLTDWALLSLAPLTASGCNEIVLRSTLRKNVETAARAIAGPKWRHQYTVTRLSNIKRFWLKCNGCPARFSCDAVGIADASHHDDIAGRSGPAFDCVKYADYECGGWTLEVSP